MRKRNLLPCPLPCVVLTRKRLALGQTLAELERPIFKPVGRVLASGGIKPLGAMFAGRPKLRKGFTALH